MKHFCILILLILVYVNCLKAQIEPRVSIKKPTIAEKTILRKNFTKYKLFSIDKTEIVDNLKKRGQCQFQLDIDSENKWDIDLQLNDIRSPNYKASYISELGTYECDAFIPNTFKGKTSDGKEVRFTIDENNFLGVIFSDEKQTIMQQIRDYTNNKEDEGLILYDNCNLVFYEEESDPINDIFLTLPENIISTNILNSNSTPCTYYLEIATDADFQFYANSMNRDLIETYKYILSVLNVVEGVYKSTFDLRFIVTFQNVWTTSDPYSTTSLLHDFRSYWNSYMHNERDLAHLFTGKGTNSMGSSFAGNIGNNSAYSFSKYDYEKIYKIVAHEIGHNLSATDLGDAITDCCGSGNVSIMCQGKFPSYLSFCQRSINEIEAFLRSKSSILKTSYENNLVLSGKISVFNQYQAKQKITSTQVIESGIAIYKANEFQLNSGFEVKAGAIFETIIGDYTGCD